MQNRVDHAKQFLPFDALKGFNEALRKAEKEEQEKLDFSKFKVGDSVFIQYYYQLDYMEIVGTIQKISDEKELLFLTNTRISLSDIVGIYKV